MPSEQQPFPDFIENQIEDSDLRAANQTTLVGGNRTSRLIDPPAIKGRPAAYESFPAGMGNLVYLHRSAIQQYALVFAGEI